MKRVPRKYLLTIGMAVLGVLGGFIYWRFVGCKTGSCPITSNWHMSTLMGGLIGYLAGDSINDGIKKRKEQKNLT